MTRINSKITDFAAETARNAAIAFKGLATTHTISPSGTVNFVERVPGEEAVISIGYPGPFAPDATLDPPVYGLDGDVLDGPSNANLGGGRYLPIFRAHADITTVSHVHTPYLGAWSQSHRELPIRYVPVQRWTRTRTLPIYIDRRQGEANFILEVLAKDPGVPAILEANGGAAAWGRTGVRALAPAL